MAATMNGSIDGDIEGSLSASAGSSITSIPNAFADEMPPQQSAWRLFAKMIVARKVVLASVAILAILFILAVFAGAISPFDPEEMVIENRLVAPGASHWFGADEFGRDVLTRVMHGGQTSLAVGFLTIVFAGFFGVLLGVLAGFFSKLDGILSKLLDAMMAFPDILLAIALVSVLGANMWNVITALGIVYTPRIARVVRASTLVIRELPYVEAARALGVKTPRILTRHILRNLVSPITVQATFIFANAILAESGLSFLGVGISPETPTWGNMISSGQQYAREAIWIMLFPGLAIVLTVFSLQMVGDALRDFMDPRLAKTV